jgi:hypothetical protein
MGDKNNQFRGATDNKLQACFRDSCALTKAFLARDVDRSSCLVIQVAHETTESGMLKNNLGADSALRKMGKYELK